MASYARVESRRDGADLAVVVADAWQRQGLATRLLSALSARARQAGITRFEVIIQGDNSAALGLLRRLKPAARLDFSQGVLSGTASTEHRTRSHDPSQAPAARQRSAAGLDWLARITTLFARRCESRRRGRRRWTSTGCTARYLSVARAGAVILARVVF